MRTDRVKNELQHLSLNKGNAAQAQAVEPSGTAVVARSAAKKMGGVPGELRAGRDDGPSPRMETC